MSVFLHKPITWSRIFPYYSIARVALDWINWSRSNRSMFKSQVDTWQPNIFWSERSSLESRIDVGWIKRKNSIDVRFITSFFLIKLLINSMKEMIYKTYLGWRISTSKRSRLLWKKYQDFNQSSLGLFSCSDHKHFQNLMCPSITIIALYRSKKFPSPSFVISEPWDVLEVNSSINIF